MEASHTEFLKNIFTVGMKKRVCHSATCSSLLEIPSNPYLSRNTETELCKKKKTLAFIWVKKTGILQILHSETESIPVQNKEMKKQSAKVV